MTNIYISTVFVAVLILCFPFECIASLKVPSRKPSDAPIHHPCNMMCIIGDVHYIDANGNCSCVPGSKEPSKKPSSKTSQEPTPNDVNPCNMMCINGDVHYIDAAGNCKCIPETKKPTKKPVLKKPTRKPTSAKL